MTHTLSRCAVLVALAFVPACAATTEPVDPDSDTKEGEDNLGQVQQGICVNPVTATPPVPVGQIVGMNNEISSGSYSYGNGPCDGWAVKFTGLGSVQHGVLVQVMPGDVVTDYDTCAAITGRLWVWSRPAGSFGAWTYRGTDSGMGGYIGLTGKCRTVASVWVPGAGTHEIIAKLQSRSERTVTLSNGNTVGYAFNRPVAGFAHGS